MDVPTGPATSFRADAEWFDGMPPSTVGSLVANLSDVAVVMNHDGTVCDLAVSDADLPRDAFEDWVGRNFRELVTLESQPKVDRLLENVADGVVTAATHLNHTRRSGDDLPVRYRATPLNNEWLLAIGRDLSPLASAQRRLIAAQRNAEREYQRLRLTEARFRQYFRHADEPALFLDGEDRVSDANPAAAARWPQLGRLTGRRLVDLLAPADRGAVTTALAEVRSGGSASVVPLRDGPLILAALRQDRAGVLVRFAGHPASASASAGALPLARVLEAMPDAFVVTDNGFTIQVANAAFLGMTEAVAPEAVLGSSLERWLGRPGVDLSVIRTALS
ncbi:MAG: PAS domain-containing protein, partial [Pseudomonadota bacterium]